MNNPRINDLKELLDKAKERVFNATRFDTSEGIQSILYFAYDNTYLKYLEVVKEFDEKPDKEVVEFWEKIKQR